MTPRRRGKGDRHRLRLRVHRRRGQSLVELALVAPILVILLVGAAQVAAIAFGLVSIDSATREGARAGALAPNTSLMSGGATWYTAGTPTHQCNQTDFQSGTTGNPICEAVLNSSGTLKTSLFTSSNNPCADSTQACVTITVLPPAGLSSVVTGPQSARLEASACNGANATVTGVVSGIPGGQTATVTDLTGDTQPTNTSGSYSICVKANGSTTTQNLTAQVGPTCGGYSGSSGPFNVVSGGSYTVNITVSGPLVCPTPTPTPLPTATPTPGPCTNQQATVIGVVTYNGSSLGMAAGIASTITGETTSTNLAGAFSICVTANGSTKSQTLAAQVGNVLCGGYNGSVGPFAVASSTTYTENIALTAEPNCPPPTPPPTVSTTCTSETVPPSTVNPTPYYIRVTVTYPVQIFVPFIGAIFQSQPGYRVITTTVTDQIEPCALTNGD